MQQLIAGKKAPNLPIHPLSNLNLTEHSRPFHKETLGLTTCIDWLHAQIFVLASAFAQTNIRSSVNKSRLQDKAPNKENVYFYGVTAPISGQEGRKRDLEIEFGQRERVLFLRASLCDVETLAS